MDGKDPANNLPPDYVLPPSYFRARDMASHISRGLDHVRVDFLVDGDSFYVGELTIYPGSGYGTERLSHTDHAIELACARSMHLSGSTARRSPGRCRSTSAPSAVSSMRMSRS